MAVKKKVLVVKKREKAASRVGPLILCSITLKHLTHLLKRLIYMQLDKQRK